MRRPLNLMQSRVKGKHVRITVVLSAVKRILKTYINQRINETCKTNQPWTPWKPWQPRDPGNQQNQGTREPGEPGTEPGGTRRTRGARRTMRTKGTWEPGKPGAQVCSVEHFNAIVAISTISIFMHQHYIQHAAHTTYSLRIRNPWCAGIPPGSFWIDAGTFIFLST